MSYQAKDRSSFKRRQLFTSITLLFFGVLFGLMLLPQSQPASQPGLISQARGGVTLPQRVLPVCDHPAEVFRTLHLPLGKVPAKEVLKQLPRPDSHSGAAPDLTYDPQQDLLCATNATALYVRYIQPQPTAQPTLPPTASATATTSAASSVSWSSQWVSGILSALWGSMAQGWGDAMQDALKWANKLKFMFNTPADLTYNHKTVQRLFTWVLGVVDSAIVLILVIGGYNHMFGRTRDFRELVQTLIYAAIAANLSLFVLGQVIDLHNELCGGLLGELQNLGFDKSSIFWTTVKWVEVPAYVSCAYLLELIMSLLLMLQMLMRIALINFLLILAPVGMLCFALPQMKPWGQAWAQAFVSALILQFLQLLCISLGSALVASAQITLDIVSPLVGLASFFMAFKIYSMLLSNVLRASHGDIGKSFVQSVQTIAQYVAMVG